MVEVIMKDFGQVIKDITHLQKLINTSIIFLNNYNELSSIQKIRIRLQIQENKKKIRKLGGL